MKIALVEVSSSHEECLYSQLKFLDQPHLKVDLVINPVLSQQIEPYADLVQTVHTFSSKKRGFSNFTSAVRLVKLLKQYDLVVFNTASSSKVVRNTAVLLNLYRKVQVVGVLHNTNKLNSSFTQKLISSKIKKYFVLADHLKTQDSAPVKTESFYPIYFPKTKKIPTKKSKEIWITIPGRIDAKRRDYHQLSQALKTTGPLKNIKILFLGRLDPNQKEAGQLGTLFESAVKMDNVIFFDRFIANEDYHNYLAQSDAIMPLLHQEKSYLNYKISGSFNLAYAHQKPMLNHLFFKEIPDLKANSLFFDDRTLAGLLIDLDKGMFQLEGHPQDKKFDFKLQQRRYLEFLMDR